MGAKQDEAQDVKKQQEDVQEAESRLGESEGGAAWREVEQTAEQSVQAQTAVEEAQEEKYIEDALEQEAEEDLSKRGETTEPEELALAGAEASVGGVITITSLREMNEFISKVNNGNSYTGYTVQLANNLVYDSNVNNFTPISGFEGTFDGCGHTISNIDITKSEYACMFNGLSGTVENLKLDNISLTCIGSGSACMFKNLSGTVKNLKMSNINIISTKSSSHVGGITDYNYGTIDNCLIVSGNIKFAPIEQEWEDNKSYVGGIDKFFGVGGIAFENKGRIQNCSNSALLEGTEAAYEGKYFYDIYVGGIASMNSGTISNCYNQGAISGEPWYSGGIAAINGGTIQNCYNTGTALSGIVDEVESEGIVSNSYCSEESAKKNFFTMNGIEKNCKALPAASMKTAAFVSTLNSGIGNNDTWRPWEISNAESEFPVHVKTMKQTIMAESDVYSKVMTDKPFSLGAQSTSGSLLLYASGNPNVATVDALGNVTLHGEGSTVITITAQANDSFEGAIRQVTVNVAKIQQKIQCSYTSIEMVVTDLRISLAATTNGDGALTYATSDPNVALVSRKGRITPVGGGTAVITITAAGTDTYTQAVKTVAVRISRLSQEIRCNYQTIRLRTTDSPISLKASSNKKTQLTYSSDNTKVVKVTEDGAVKPVGEGTAVITICAMESARYNAASRTVTVLVERGEQSITCKNASKTYTRAQMKKKKRTFAIGAKANGAVTYSITDKKSKKYLSVSKKGKVTLKKKTPKGTYKVKVTAAATAKYKKAVKTIKIYVR